MDKELESYSESSDDFTSKESYACLGESRAAQILGDGKQAIFFFSETFPNFK